jgi:hypothetical protein
VVAADPLVQEDLDGLAEELGLGETEGRLDLGVGIHDEARPIHRDDGVGRRFEHRVPGPDLARGLTRPSRGRRA